MSYEAPLIIDAGIGQAPLYVWNITASDTDRLVRTARAIRVGGAGDLAIKTAGGDVTIIPDLVAGETVVALVVLVYSTGTTATGIVGLA